jgi:hypothetical protein
MSRFLRFLLVLVPFSVSFALTPHDLHKRVDAVQKQLNLTEWHVIVRSLSAQQMYETNKCKCYGESMIFPASHVTVLNILDDEAYVAMGWADLKEIHAHQRFVVLHELLHVSVMLSYADLDQNGQEGAVRETSVMIADEPEKR